MLIHFNLRFHRLCGEPTAAWHPTGSLGSLIPSALEKVDWWLATSFLRFNRRFHRAHGESPDVWHSDRIAWIHDSIGLGNSPLTAHDFFLAPQSPIPSRLQRISGRLALRSDRLDLRFHRPWGQSFDGSQLHSCASIADSIALAENPMTTGTPIGSLGSTRPSALTIVP